MNIYLLRHGETNINKNGKYQSAVDVNVNMKMQKSSNMKMHKYFIVLCGKNTGYYFY